MKDESERYIFTKRCIYNETDTSNFTNWIEGIGDLDYPFTSEWICSLFDPSTIAKLICFSYGDVLIYENDSYINCKEKKEKLKFIDGKSIWISRFTGFFPGVESSRTKFSEDEKVIEGRKYYALLVSTTENGDDFKSTNVFYREEGSKVYKLIDGKDKLIYDFDLQLGDSFDLDILFENLKMTVSKVDYIVFSDGIKRKHIYFNCPFSNNPWHEWIEGVGSINSTYYCLLDIGESLSCYYYNDKLVKNFLNSDCWLVNTKDENSELIDLYPNPASSMIELKGIDDLSVEKIEIYDQIGRKISGKFTLEGNSLDVSQLNKGVYNLQLIIKNNVRVNKMFVKF